MIQNYDTNGLVFLLNFEKSSTNDEQVYKRAVLNILNAQKFSCIPLVDGPRIRSNTNNLTDRATYEEGGKVTHIARKGIYEGEEEIEIIPISKIKHVQGDCDLIEGLLLLFEEREDGICDFIITVGGTSEYPIAMFTLNELKNSSTKEHLFRRVAYYGADIGKAKGANFVDFAKSITTDSVADSTYAADFWSEVDGDHEDQIYVHIGHLVNGKFDLAGPNR